MMSTMTSLTNKYINPYFRIMSDTITKWHEMEEEEKAQAVEQLKQLEERELAENAEQYNKELENSPHKTETYHKDYIWVLDFADSKVYSYKVPTGVNDLESFIIGAGHNLNTVEWMNTNECKVEYGN